MVKNSIPLLVLFGLAAQPVSAQVVQVIQTVPAALPSAAVTPKIAGDTLLVECDYGSPSAPAGSVVDSSGNQYVPLGPANSSATLSQILSISSPIASTASITVTCPGTNAAGGEIYALELFGPVSVDSGPLFASSSSGPASGSLSAATADLILAFCVTGTCSPVSGWTTLSSFHSNLVASQVAASSKVSASFPVTRDWVLTLVALKPAPTTTLQVTLAGTPGGSGVVASFPISNSTQLPSCTSADGVCSISVQVCDGATPPNCLNGNAGSISLVKTATLPVASKQTTLVVLAAPSR